MERHFIQYKSSTIHYHRFGSGEKWLFCFHGYGQAGGSFYFLEKKLGTDYTIIALDLPYHGATDWKEGLIVEPAELLNVIWQITDSEKQMISLLGYSMGGRVALHLLQLIPDWIERVVLLAPDGLHENFWYWLSTQTKPGNQLFRYTIHHAQWLFMTMRIFNKARILNRGFYKTAHYYLSNPLSRELLYQRWTTMRKFRIDFHLVKDTIYAYNIPVRMLFGRYDSIILGKRARYFSEGLEEQVKVYELEEGHQLLKEKHARTIASQFYD